MNFWCCYEFLQDVYNTCKESVLRKLSETLSRILVLPEKRESDEELYDVCRAYGLLVNAAGTQHSQDYRRCWGKVRDLTGILKVLENETKERRVTCNFVDSGERCQNTAGFFCFCFFEGQRERERDGLFTQCVR